MSLNRSPLPTQRLAFLTAEREPEPGARHAEDGVETLPQPRSLARFLELGRNHIPVLLALLLGVVLITIYAMGSSSSTEIPAVPTPIPQSSSSPTVTEIAGNPQQPREVRIHVLGAVATPGVVRVPADSIVEDAIHAAGGLLPEASPGDLNLAATLTDGQQIIIGTADEPRGEVVTPSMPESSGALLDLNTATDQQLQELPGVGPVLAADIVAWRTEQGPFTEVAQLRNVTGIGPKTYERLAPLVTV